jgi:hypothetical protein
MTPSSTSPDPGMCLSPDIQAGLERDKEPVLHHEDTEGMHDAS